MAEPSDNFLLREYAERQSEPAFRELVQRHLNFVYSVAVRYVGNQTDAQDVAQAVFVILAQKSVRLCERGSLTGWLYETTRLTASQLLRTRTRRLAREQEAYMQSTLERTGDDPLWHQLSPHLEEAMSRLRAGDRELLALRFYEKKTGDEAAVVLGIGAAAARKRTDRALEKLRNFFARRGVSSTSAIIAGAISSNSVQAAPAGLAQSISAVAIAKSATAPTSTLTLVKGALKLMTWTKAKTGVVIAVMAVLAVTSTTVVGFKLAQLHRWTAKQAAGLFPVSMNATGNIQPDGTILCQATMEEINNSTRIMRTDNITLAGGISRMTDELGEPLKIARQPNGRYLITLNKPVPPRGKISYTFEGVMAELIKPNADGDYAVGFTNNAGNVTDMHCVQVWRLPVGATLLSKIPEMHETANDGQIELRIDKIVPPNGGLPVGFSYRLAARTP